MILKFTAETKLLPWINVAISLSIMPYCTSSSSVSEIWGCGRTSLLRFFTESGLFSLKKQNQAIKYWATLDQENIVAACSSIHVATCMYMYCKLHINGPKLIHPRKIIIYKPIKTGSILKSRNHTLYYSILITGKLRKTLPVPLPGVRTNITMSDH